MGEGTARLIGFSLQQDYSYQFAWCHINESSPAQSMMNQSEQVHCLGEIIKVWIITVWGIRLTADTYTGTLIETVD